MTTFTGRTLIVTVGLPRSGKSTWALQQGHPMVSPDAIRYALHGYRFAVAAEPYVWAIAETMVKALFGAGHLIVILDATNISQKRRDQWMSPSWTTRFKVIDTPAAVCLERAVAAGDPYIIPVISRQAAEWDPPTEHLL